MRGFLVSLETNPQKVHPQNRHIPWLELGPQQTDTFFAWIVENDGDPKERELILGKIHETKEKTTGKNIKKNEKNKKEEKKKRARAPGMQVGPCAPPEGRKEARQVVLPRLLVSVGFAHPTEPPPRSRGPAAPRFVGELKSRRMGRCKPTSAHAQ